MTKKFKFIEESKIDKIPEQKPIGVNNNIKLTKRGKGWSTKHISFADTEAKKKNIGQQVFIKYDQTPACPVCSSNLHLISLRVDHTPYVHVDFMMGCPEHGWTWTFGVPISKEHASAMHIYDSNAVGATKKFAELGDRECPWLHGVMVPTKIFGDWMPGDDVVEYQWKCPWCHVTHHEGVKRDFPHGSNKPLSDEESEMLKERLRRMGYVE